MDKALCPPRTAKAACAAAHGNINGFQECLMVKWVAKICASSHPLRFCLRRRLIVRIDADAGRVCDLKRANRPRAAGIKLVSGWALLSTHPLVICARNPAG